MNKMSTERRAAVLSSLVEGKAHPDLNVAAQKSFAKRWKPWLDKGVVQVVSKD